MAHGGGAGDVSVAAAATTTAPVEEEKVHGGKVVAHTAGRKGRMVHHASNHAPK